MKSNIQQDLPTYQSHSIIDADYTNNKENNEFLNDEDNLFKPQCEEKGFQNLNLEISGNNPLYSNEPAKAQDSLITTKIPEKESQIEDSHNDDVDNSSVKAINSECDVKTKSVSNSNKLVRANKKSRKSKTTEFAYLLERKAFRMMRKYYKEQFEFYVEDPEYKKNLPNMTAEELNALVYNFMEKELKSFCTLLTQKDYERTRDALKTIIL